MKSCVKCVENRNARFLHAAGTVEKGQYEEIAVKVVDLALDRRIFKAVERESN